MDLNYLANCNVIQTHNYIIIVISMNQEGGHLVPTCIQLVGGGGGRGHVPPGAPIAFTTPAVS